MVAEAVKEIETPAPEAEAPASEPAEETPSAPAPELEDDNFSEVLSELGLGDVATSEGTDATPNADESAADPYAGLSPQEIAKKVREEVTAEASAATNTREYQNYVAGVSRSFQARDNELKEFAKRYGLDTDATDDLRQIFAVHNGQWDVLHKHVTRTEADALREGMKKALVDAATAAGIKDADFASAQDFIAKLTEHAKSGAVPESKVKEREKAAAENAIKAYRKRLIDNGVDIPGVRVPEVPNNPGNGGGMSLAAFNALSLDDQAKVPAAERARIYAAAQRR